MMGLWRWGREEGEGERKGKRGTDENRGQISDKLAPR